jgi:hypothetical protein
MIGNCREMVDFLMEGVLHVVHQSTELVDRISYLYIFFFMNTYLHRYQNYYLTKL